MRRIKHTWLYRPFGIYAKKTLEENTYNQVIHNWHELQNIRNLLYLQFYSDKTNWHQNDKIITFQPFL